MEKYRCVNWLSNVLLVLTEYLAYLRVKADQGKDGVFNNNFQWPLY
jgi:hypothetical protein